ncbi:pimeloyl-ACP methyl ester carboxylesterase [Nitrosomonas sp. Nm84]|uniref:alpha/beta fold hydrolase n=1 Tax=Nitrosomonas sp. Nm84 TaxID=200124 RepID=UPI000D75458A|nr:alpha/beta hydrolase [Nitrosomonas sp. Nm84]PXW80002.1 pimeloyl-ACP methyl ester carboxylesterase [Nitrosomonas sp. Nm84]
MEISVKRLLVPTLSNDGQQKKPHAIAYTDWGDLQNPHVVICVHGLTRNCRDFDYLARELQSDCRVISVDVVGRGQSDWLEQAHDYDYYPVYLSDAMSLISHIQAQYRTAITLDWVGISLGGLIGMILAIQPNIPVPINKLVISDIGPLIPAAALKRIADYVGEDIRFNSFEEFKQYMKAISVSFGPLTEEQWDHMAIHSALEYADGSYGFRYDPRISVSFKEREIKDIDLWNQWDQLNVPTLVLRGMASDILSVDTAAQMQVRGAKAKIVELPGIGHAPMLMDAGQMKIVRDFILS